VLLSDRVARLQGASWAIGDQALISATNFLGMVAVARALSPGDFGIYALAFTGIYVANNFQAALITQPHGVLAAGRDAEGYRAYTASTGAMQILLTCVIVLPLVVAGLAAGLDGVGAILVAVAIAIAMWQAAEFARRVLYFERRLLAVFAVDCVSYGGQLFGLILLAVAGSLTIVSGLLVVSLTSAAAALLGLLLMHESLRARPSGSALRQNFHYGKWLVGSEVGAFLCLSIYPFLLTAFRGPADAAVLAATNLLLNPLNVIWFAIGTAVPMALARARAARGDRAAHRELRNLYVATAPFVIAYCLVVSVFAGPLLGLVFGAVYAGFAWVVALHAVARVIGYHDHLVSVGLRARRQTRDVFLGYAVATPFSLTVGTWLTYAFGLAGALVAMIGLAVIWTAVRAIAYRRGAMLEPAATDW